MDLILNRFNYSELGVLSYLQTLNRETLFYTLEHAYALDSTDTMTDTWIPKLPVGEFRCVRGEHQLHNSRNPFETFEITGVSGHSGILFHVGNYNNDSDGCVLLGTSYTIELDTAMVLNSKEAFDKFMMLQQDVTQFMLKVV